MQRFKLYRNGNRRGREWANQKIIRGKKNWCELLENDSFVHWTHIESEQKKTAEEQHNQMLKLLNMFHAAFERASAIRSIIFNLHCNSPSHTYASVVFIVCRYLLNSVLADFMLDTQLLDSRYTFYCRAIHSIK